jgi:hypothetical protein
MWWIYFKNGKKVVYMIQNKNMHSLSKNDLSWLEE